MTEFFRRLHYLLNRHRFDQELAQEMEVHREMAAGQGGEPFGNTLRLREEKQLSAHFVTANFFGEFGAPARLGRMLDPSRDELIVAGLLVRALDWAVSVHPGFEYQHVISIDPRLVNQSPAGAEAHLDALASRLHDLPGARNKT